MKKVYKTKTEPNILKEFRLKHPCQTWTYFHQHRRGGYRQVKETIIRDQHGLCAYCETAIARARTEEEVDDFRVEHFYPKSGTEKSAHNYHLDWQNLIGVCHGGSQPGVPEAMKRFSSRQIDRSCDVLKGDKNLTKQILNPLTIPMDRLWCFSEFDGTMYVDALSCPEHLQDRAQNTIEELNLNAPRLCRMRKEVIEKIGTELVNMVADGTKIDDALEILAVAFLAPDERGMCLPYFSTIRWYLGNGAERMIDKFLHRHKEDK